MASDGTLKFDTKINSSGFQKGINSISDIAKKGMKATGNILKGSIAAIGGLGAAAIKVGSDFESGMSKVAAISGASSQELEDLTEKAKEMGANTKFSATESAAAFEYMAMAGWKTGDMLNGIEGIMNLAAASGEDLAATSDIVTDALTAFGMKASDAGHFSDILAQASSNANTNVGMMGETFKYVAPVAGALGYTAEDTALAIGLMANAGIKSSQAGTSLRSMMSRLTKPTKEVGIAMDALGVSLTNSDGSMKTLNEVMQDLREGFNGLSEAESAELASMLAGQEAMSGLLAIVNASEDDFNKLERSIYNCDGAAARMAETMSDNLQGQITILKSGLEGLGISLYENMQVSCMGIVKEVQAMVQDLQDAFNDGGLDSLVTTFGSILSRIVEGAANAAPNLIDAATGLVSSFCESLKSSSGIGDAASSLITSLVTGILSCAGDIWTTAITLVGKMADGLAAGAPQMVQTAAQCVTDILDCIIEQLPDILQAGVEIVLAIIDGIAEALPTLIEQAANILLEICNAIVQNLPAVMEAALDIVQALIDGLVSGLPLLLEGAIQLLMGIIEALPVIIEQLLQALPRLITAILDFFTDNIPLIIDGAIQLLMGIVDAIPTIIQEIVESLPQIITALVEGIVGAWPQLLDAAVTLLMALIDAIPQIVIALVENLPQIITAIVTGLADAMPEIFTSAKDLLWNIITAIPEVVVGLAKAVPDIIGGIVKGLVGGVKAVFDAAVELGGGILDGIKSFFGIHSPSTVMEDQGDYLVQGMINGLASLPDKAMEAFNGVLNNIVAWGMEIAAKGVEVATTFVTDCVTVISELPGQIWTWLVDTVNKVIQWGVNLASSACTAAQNAINKVVDWFKQLPGKIWTWLTSTVTKVIQFGSDLKSKAITAAQGFVTNLVDGVKSLPDKFLEIGSNIVSGIWDGICNGWNWLVDKVKNLAGSLFEGAKEALGINSPSKVFSQEVGRWIPPGIGVGMEKAMPDLQRQVDTEMEELASRMRTAVAIETGGITVRTRAKAEHDADTDYPKGCGDTYYDQHVEQENNYHVPVASPSETSKAQREAARNLLGGVK